MISSFTKYRYCLVMFLIYNFSIYLHGYQVCILQNVNSADVDPPIPAILTPL